MTQTLVLALPNFLKLFIVETDASSLAIDAVLTQNGYSIAYFNKKLGKKLSLASTYIRELYVVTQAVAKWQHYLLGCWFSIKTDHQGLKELMTWVVLTPEQQYYLSKLIGYDFDISFRSGKHNQVVEALSRQEDISISLN